MDYRITALILISVTLYTVAFVHPSLFYWTMFICFIPLFYMSLSATFSGLFYIVFWAVLLMLVQWWPLITIIIKQGAHPLKYCIPLFCLLLVAIGGLVAGLLSLMINKYIHSLYIRVFLHTGICWLFFEWIYRYLLIAFGYTLSYPLLPLAITASLLRLCFFVPAAFLTFCLLLAQMAVASFYCYGHKKFLIIALVGYAPFFIGLLLPAGKTTIPNVQRGIPPPDSAAMLDDAQEIAKCIIDARGCDYLIFPESSFCYDCLSDPAIIQLWQEYVDEYQTVIIGTHVKRADQWQVTAGVVTQQEVSWHDKSFLLPFAEYIPRWLPSYCKDIFLQDHESFSPAHTSAPGDVYDLLICAELFLSKDCWYQMANRKNPIIVLASDSWCAETWLPDLMLLFTRFKAIEWGRVIVYSSQNKFEIINRG